MAVQVKKNLHDYQEQQKKNEESFFEILKQLNPELFVLIKMIMNENLSLTVFYKIARQLININAGTGYGNINIIIENKIITFIHGIEKDRINEQIVKIT